MKITQGDIILVPFPFTDLSSVKTRPALVISNNLLKGNDIVGCGITSQKSDFYRFELTNGSLVHGSLPLKSYVCFAKIVSLDKKIVRKVVAQVKQAPLRAIVKNITQLLEI